VVTAGLAADHAYIDALRRGKSRSTRVWFKTGSPDPPVQNGAGPNSRAVDQAICSVVVRCSGTLVATNTRLSVTNGMAAAMASASLSYSA
jgi:hypothetical protein